MAAESRADTRAVAWLDALRGAPWSSDVFQALRRIECAFRDRARLGEGQHASDEPVRLSQEASLAFAPHTIASVETDAIGRLKLVTTFFGLLGPQGPLPLHISDYARDRMINSGDRTLVRFLDLFHHRMIALFYRAFANTEPVVQRDRPAADRFRTFVGALCGMGMPSLRDRDLIADDAKLFFAGRLASQPRNAEGLRAMIGTFFEVPTEIEQFVGEWVELPVRSRWRLGRSGIGSPLGRATAIGRRAWLCQSKFRIVVGPLEPDRFPHWLPGGQSLARLEALVKSYVGDQLEWDVRVLMSERTRRPWSLGSSAQLGWTTWLGSRPNSLVVKPSQGRTAPPGSHHHPSQPAHHLADTRFAPQGN